jgi:hypothetical protein
MNPDTAALNTRRFLYDMITGADPADMETWKCPITAARLWEFITDAEKSRLPAAVCRRLAPT